MFDPLSFWRHPVAEPSADPAPQPVIVSPPAPTNVALTAAPPVITEIVDEIFDLAETATALHPIEHEAVVLAHKVVDAVLAKLGAKLAGKLAAKGINATK